MNYRLLHMINSLAGHSWLLDDLMVFVAKYLVYVVFVVLALVGLPFLRRRDWQPLFAAGSGLVLAFALGLLATTVYFEPRPFTTHPGLHVLTPHDPGKSFPSDHATAAFAISFVLLAFLSRRWGLVVLGCALLIGFARVYDGIHYPGDIAGSAVIAALGVGAVSAALAALARRHPQDTALPSVRP